MPISNEPMRNHASVLVEYFVIMLFVLAMMMFSLFGEDGDSAVYMLIGTAIIEGVILFLIFLFWRKTTISFNETEIVVDRDTVFKKKRTIPYVKVASVNITRSIIDRIFGTSKIKINVNSANNAAEPEVTFAFKREITDEIREFLFQFMYDQKITIEEEKQIESVISFNPGQVILHSIFSNPTAQLGFSALMVVYTVVTLYLEAEGGVIIALIMFASTFVIPVVMLILRYMNFKVFRVGDTIRMEHGAIQTYRSSFNVRKINAIRIKKPFIARLMHKSCIEAEVVGINASNGDTRPVICLLTSDAEVERVLKALVPEFCYDMNPVSQPTSSRNVLLAHAAIYSAMIVAVMAYPCYWAAGVMSNETYIQIVNVMIGVTFIGGTIALVLLMFFMAHMAFHVRKVDMSDDTFTFIDGMIDWQTVIMKYDRVQISMKVAGPLMRRSGLVKARVYILSSLGGTSVSSGFFPPEVLEPIDRTMFERLANGTYKPL